MAQQVKREIPRPGHKRLKTKDPPRRLAPWRIRLRPGRPPGPGIGGLLAYAAALAEVGTEAIVLRICEAIW